jgi:polar amino acid transport system permease protein
MVWLSWGFVWLFRSIPLIVLLLILNNLGYLYETIWIGVPFTQITLFSGSTTQLITPFDAAVLGLTLNQGAFAAEIIRGGILSVDEGQLEAAAALGLPRRRQLRRIVLPQAMRTILPTAFNDIIGLAKGTSNVYVLALPELFCTIQVIYRRNLEVIPLLMVATVWYLVILSALSVIQFQVERHFARGALRKPPVSFFTRIRPRRPRDDRPVAPLGTIQGGAVRIEGLSKCYGSNRVLDRISLSIPAGGVAAVIGPSGSGKSTLLRLINHLERADEGLVTIDGELIGYRQSGTLLHEL